LSSTALPAASAGATFWASEAIGEFQGVMADVHGQRAGRGADLLGHVPQDLERVPFDRERPRQRSIFVEPDL
jgi:hypothetical protein